jgi:hypothetical protein
VRRPWVITVLAGAVAASCAASLAVTAGPAVGAVAAAGGWGKAIEVPGLARLSSGLGGVLAEVSCSSPGNCAAGGTYSDGPSHSQAFVVGEKNGTWDTAIEVPGLAALNTGGDAHFDSLSCGSAGNCAAGGEYSGSGPQAFVVSEKNGTWGKAIEVPGLTALSADPSASVNSVSCASAGNCAVGGDYSSKGGSLAFVVSERNGTWGKAIEVPGLTALNADPDAGVNSVSCASAGNCAAVGSYRATDGLLQAFVVSQNNGTWGKAIEVPVSAALQPTVTVYAVSCASAGNCAGTGYYGGGTNTGPLVVSEKNGTWGKAIPVPGTTSSAINGAGTVSCASPGNCVAGGDLAPAIEHPYQAFVVSQNDGTWGQAIEVPGSGALNAGGNADVASVSCASAGNCAAGGEYLDSSSHQQAFVVSENNGTWGQAIEVPGSAALNTGGFAQIVSVSCTAAGYCAAGGEYSVSSEAEVPFVVSRT